jgi:hypothetical protein
MVSIVLPQMRRRFPKSGLSSDLPRRYYPCQRYPSFRVKSLEEILRDIRGLVNGQVRQCDGYFINSLRMIGLSGRASCRWFAKNRLHPRVINQKLVVLRALVGVDFEQIIANIFEDTVLWSPEKRFSSGSIRDPIIQKTEKESWFHFFCK